MIFQNSLQNISHTNSLRSIQQPQLQQQQRKFTETSKQVKDTTFKSWFKGFQRGFWLLLLAFGRKASTHGIIRVLAESISKIERLIWFLIEFAAFLGCLYICLILSQRFQSSRFQTVIDTIRMPIFKIPFPVITICNLNRLNWQRLAEAKRRFLPNENSSEKLELFETILGGYDDIQFANFQTFLTLKDKNVNALNNVNFSQVVDFMGWRCEELLINCEWRRTAMNCCDIFSKRRSKNGLCWSFNTLETAEGLRMKRLDSTYPWRASSAGVYSGINVRVLINEDKHYPRSINDKGITVMLTEQYSWYQEPLVIQANTENSIEIEPTIYFYDNATRSLPSDQRECVFSDESNSPDYKSLYGYMYMMENCLAECQQEYLMRFCNCTMDLLFPPGRYPNCKATDLLCLAQNNDIFQHTHPMGEEEYFPDKHLGMKCSCYRNCYTLFFDTEIRPSILPPDVRNDTSYVDLDIHFRADGMMVYKTNLIFDWVDLLVAFGGIAGLFLGCSIISAMEFIYFVFVEIPIFIYGELEKLWRQRREDKEKNSVPGFGVGNRIAATRKSSYGSKTKK